MNSTQLQHCEYLQRQGRTLTEIAEAMGLDRRTVVDALYVQKVRDKVVADPEIVPARAPYAGAARVIQ